MTIMRRIMSMLLVLLLAGCGEGLFPSPPPPDLYRLSPPETVSTAGPRVAAQLLVGAISAPSALDTVRIALSPSLTRVEYFAKAEWTDRAPALLQAFLLGILERSGRFTRVARHSLALRADYVVLGTLRHFEADYQAGTPPRVRVAVELQILRMSSGTVLAQRDFAATVSVGKNSLPVIVEAFDAAVHRALHDVPSWVAGTLLRPVAKRH